MNLKNTLNNISQARLTFSAGEAKKEKIEPIETRSRELVLVCSRAAWRSRDGLPANQGTAVGQLILIM